MDELEARANRQLDGLRGFQEKLQAISVRETSADGLVTVEVDGKGALVDLRLAHGANELGAARLAEQIVATSALAAQKAYAHIAAATEEFNESFGDMLAARPGE
ncbi:YbaB/EbfC family nucleoid-associated protein [Gordonia sp. zg691]|uniref:YbaB/EbfC family nucleoid-associated protein n=1 Tax=Gordonia jinghuaiqii TaxID=2758710 RepID=UPI0016627ABE|nr:YbaB/EbfC family nucleoid-associated protein [Gordonia jinghuaiqii]MBD0860868.1 YbaB/EbfC family nucleoid-associated protein [Gordonia jinghuaiqii]